MPQPAQGKRLYRRERPPVSDPAFFDRNSNMRNGVPFDTNGLKIEEYVAQMVQQRERRFEVTMSVGHASSAAAGDPVVLARVVTPSYTEGRVAASRVYLHRLVKDIEAVAMNTATV
jgi:hypothetical protein